MSTNSVSGPGNDSGIDASAFAATQTVPRLGLDGEHAFAVDPEVETGEQWRVRGLRDDDPAIGVADVVGELLAPAGRVDADDGRARERGAAEQEDVLGNVVEQHADMERPGAGKTGGAQHRRAYRALVRDLRPRPRPILEDETRVVVVGARRDERGDRRRGHRQRTGMRVAPRTSVERDSSGSPVSS